MFKKILNLIFGDANTKALKKYEEKVKEINALEPEIQKLSDEELKNKTKIFQEKIRSVIKEDKTEEENNDAIQKEMNKILPEAFAVVREASRRVLGMRHFDVQLIGGMVLHNGAIAEMKTGEGKTFVAVLPAYLNALSGKGVHIITVNDYLVKRDAEWMGRVHKFLGLSVGCITDATPMEKRKEEYA